MLLLGLACDNFFENYTFSRAARVFFQFSIRVKKKKKVCLCARTLSDFIKYIYTVYICTPRPDFHQFLHAVPEKREDFSTLQGGFAPIAALS